MSIVVSLALIASGVLSFVYQAMAISRAPASNEKVYQTNPFRAEFSRGVFYNFYQGKHEIVAGTASVGQCTGGEGLYFCGNNSSIDNNQYVVIKNGAIYNNQLLDVREYPAISGATSENQAKWAYRANLGAGSHIQLAVISTNGSSEVRDITVTRQIRFYLAGTNTEVSFKGVTGFSDFEEGEGYRFVSGLDQAYVLNPTTLSNGNNTWIATETTPGLDERYVLWAEVHAGPGSPLVLEFKIPKIGRGSRNTMASRTVSLNIDGKVKSTDVVILYGTYAPSEPQDLPAGTEFDGWYLDAAMTQKAPDSITVNENKVLYGKTTQEPTPDNISVTTSIENGTITPSISNIEEGKDVKIEYSCNEGYVLNSIKVDSKDLDDLKSYTDNYTFNSVDKSHTIAVTCAAYPGKVGAPDTGVVSSNSIGSSNNTVLPIIISTLVTSSGIALLVHHIRRERMMRFGK